MSDAEKIIIGLVLSVLLTLVGVVWRQMHARFDAKDASLEERLKDMERALKEKITESDAKVTQTVTEQLGQISTRLSNGSTRMDTLHTGLANLRVKLAEEYQTGPETRTLISDLIAPTKEQLNRIEQTLNQFVQGNNRRQP